MTGATQFFTNKYKWAHGRAPRGTGGWAFYSTANPGQLFWANGSYTAAKAAARKHFPSGSYIVVAP